MVPPAISATPPAPSALFASRQPHTRCSFHCSWLVCCLQPPPGSAPPVLAPVARSCLPSFRLCLCDHICSGDQYSSAASTIAALLCHHCLLCCFDCSFSSSSSVASKYHAAVPPMHIASSLLSCASAASSVASQLPPVPPLPHCVVPQYPTAVRPRTPMMVVASVVFLHTGCPLTPVDHSIAIGHSTGHPIAPLPLQCQPMWTWYQPPVTFSAAAFY